MPDPESLPESLPESPPESEPLADRPEAWPVRSSEDLHRGGWVIALRGDDISPPGGSEVFRRFVLEHPGAVVVLALDDRDRVLVLQQYRHPVQLRMVELPAGLRDTEQEEPLDVAKRELLEEAQLEAGRWEHLLTTYPSPGISAERIDIFVAHDLTEADRGEFVLEHEEADMTVGWVPLDELASGVLENRVGDGPLQLAVLAYLARERRK